MIFGRRDLLPPIVERTDGFSRSRIRWCARLAPGALRRSFADPHPSLKKSWGTEERRKARDTEDEPRFSVSLFYLCSSVPQPFLFLFFSAFSAPPREPCSRSKKRGWPPAAFHLLLVPAASRKVRS